MHQFIRSAVFMAVFALMTFAAAPAQAELAITATHTITSQQATASGTDVTLNITVSNQSASSLSNVTLSLMEPLGAGGPGSTVLNLGNLTAGASVTKTWNISIHEPEMQPLPLMIEASGADANGSVVHFPLLSEVQ